MINIYASKTKLNNVYIQKYREKLYFNQIKFLFTNQKRKNYLIF